MGHLRNIKAAKCSCRIVQFAGIRLIGTSLAFGCMLLPDLPFNIFYSGIGRWIIKLFLLPISGNNYLTMTILFFGNFVMWTMHAKIGLIAAVETIIISTCFVELITQFELQVVKLRQYINKAAMFYRELQLMVQYFNAISSSQLVATLIAFGSVQVASVLQLFRSSSATSQSASLTFHQYAVKYSIVIFSLSILINMTITIIFLFGFCGRVNEASSKALLRLRRFSEFKTSTQYEKILRSLPTLKIYFGSTNFIEKQTPVVFQLFLLERIVDVLLLQ